MDFPVPSLPSSGKSDIFNKIRTKITQNGLPSDLVERLSAQLERVEKVVHSYGYKTELDKELEYLEFVASLPFNRSSQDILDLHRLLEILDSNHYGLKTVKDRILEYLSVLILNTRQGQKPLSKALALVGLVGSGKTSLAYSVAEGLGREVIRIPFGGLGSVKDLRGWSKVGSDAEPGSLMSAIAAINYNNPVVLLDEIDRVAQEARSDVMGVLVELLDPEQNFAFLDRFVGYPFDLSKVLFIATANNTSNIATAVLDRLEVIEMPAYTDEEKIVIGRDFLLPKVLKDSALPADSIIIEESLWPKIVRPLGFDAGIRSLERSIESIVRKVARKVVEGNLGPYRLTEENIGEYLQ